MFKKNLLGVERDRLFCLDTYQTETQQAQEKCQSVKFHNQPLFETCHPWATVDSSPVVVVQLWDVRSVGEYECAGAGDCADGTGRPL